MISLAKVLYISLKKAPVLASCIMCVSNHKSRIFIEMAIAYLP